MGTGDLGTGAVGGGGGVVGCAGQHLDWLANRHVAPIDWSVLNDLAIGGQ